MAQCIPPNPAFATESERQVWELLRTQLGGDALIVANLRVTDRKKDHELDLLVVIPGAGAIVVEVKGGNVWHDGQTWCQRRRGEVAAIYPVDQARDGRYAVRSYVERDPRWRDTSRSRIRWGHAVVLPYTTLADDFELPDCPRWSIIDKTQLGELGGLLWNIANQQETGCRRPDSDDVEVIVQALGGRGLPQQSFLGAIAENEDRVERLTQEQSLILRATQLLPRVEVRGGAGSGKTWLAIEQARRLTKTGQRVALICYSHGLASYLRRHVETLPRKEQPAYVGEYHALGRSWGAPSGPDESDRSVGAADFWEKVLPQRMAELAQALPAGHRYDTVVVDEAQDFADSWWPALLSALRDEESGGLYAYSDEGQRVFARFGGPPLQLVPIVLDHNLRNTVQIADCFNPLTAMPMRLMGGEGPKVKLVECPSVEVLGCADDEVDGLLAAGWRPEDVALLVTGSRHPEQVERQGAGQASYWESFWDKDQVFYGHVLGFKGLERRAVVLAVNEAVPHERSRERLYVGLSRARDQLVVVGDPAYIAQVGGREVLQRLRGQRR